MDALAIAVSGMQAASLRLDVAAGSVANVSTPGFRPSRVALSAAAGGGVAARVVPGQLSGVDLIDQVATLIEAPLAYAANARVVRADRAMTASLFSARC